jgi:hypothetical protein
MMHGKKTKMAAGGGMMTKMEAGGGVKDKMPMKTDPTTGKEKPAFLKAGGNGKDGCWWWNDVQDEGRWRH